HGAPVQAGGGGRAPAAPAHVRSVRVRGGGHRPAVAGQRPHLGAAHLVQRAHLRGREEDHLEGRRRRLLPHPALQPVSASGRLAVALTPRGTGLAALLAALAGGVLAWNHLLVGVFYDDGIYAGLAWALGHGAGFVYPNLPGTPAA